MTQSIARATEHVLGSRTIVVTHDPLCEAAENVGGTIAVYCNLLHGMLVLGTECSDCGPCQIVNVVENDGTALRDDHSRKII